MPILLTQVVDFISYFKYATNGVVKIFSTKIEMA